MSSPKSLHHVDPCLIHDRACKAASIKASSGASHCEKSHKATGHRPPEVLTDIAEQYLPDGSDGEIKYSIYSNIFKYIQYIQMILYIYSSFITILLRKNGRMDDFIR